MKKNNGKRPIGIATMLEKHEIKEYFNAFFILIGSIELVIFLAHFIGSIGPAKSPFPWKQYFFISFISPLVILIVVGLIVVGFNYYIFGDNPSPEDVDTLSFSESAGARLGHSISHFFSAIRQIPVIVGFFVLSFSAVILYRFDMILKFIGDVGEKTAFYGFVVLSVVAGGALIFLLFWLFWDFRLHKYKLEKQWEFKKQVMEKTGLIILDNNMVLNEEGKTIAFDGNYEQLEHDVLEERKIPLISKKLMWK
jgi:hypothetical protein